MTNARFVLENASFHPEKVMDILRTLHERGETVAEILEFVRALQQRMVRVETEHAASLQGKKIFDVCGTGGSGKSRINLSTALAVRLSKTPPSCGHLPFQKGEARKRGFAIAKHGNRAASGRVGSFDVIEQMGFEVSDTPQKVCKNLSEKNVAFVFAPAFHPALKPLAPIRAGLGHPTIFNYLGPLLNPVDLTAQMIGVSDEKVLQKLSESCDKLNKNALLVHDRAFGLDDVSIGGETVFAEVYDGKIQRTGAFVPEDFGIKRVTSFEDIAGGNAEQNAKMAQQMIDGTAPEPVQNFLKINEIVAREFFSRF